MASSVEGAPSPSVRSWAANHFNKQTKLPFKKVGKDEYDEQVSREFQRIGEHAAYRQVAQQEAANAAREFRREYERERKAWWRYRKRHQSGSGAADAPIDIDSSDSEIPDRSSEPSMSTAITAGIKQQNARMTLSKKTLARRNKKTKLTGSAEPAYRTNWQNHWTWQDILEAQRCVGWSPTAICKYLWQKKPEWYEPVKGQVGGLYRGTVNKWIEEDSNGNKKWTDIVLERAKDGRRGITRRSKILVGFVSLFG